VNEQRLFFEGKARDLLLDLREDKGLTYSELARRLRGYGVHIETQVLINKLRRGTYSFTFALQVLAAMGETSLRVPKLPPPSGSGRRRPHPAILDPDEP
jgi:hypothetical protein